MYSAQNIPSIVLKGAVFLQISQVANAHTESRFTWVQCHAGGSKRKVEVERWRMKEEKVWRFLSGSLIVSPGMARMRGLVKRSRTVFLDHMCGAPVFWDLINFLDLLGNSYISASFLKVNWKQSVVRVLNNKYRAQSTSTWIVQRYKSASTMQQFIKNGISHSLLTRSFKMKWKCFCSCSKCSHFVTTLDMYECIHKENVIVSENFASNKR